MPPLAALGRLGYSPAKLARHIMMQKKWTGDIVVAGNGVSAIVTALALSAHDFKVALAGRINVLPPQNDDEFWQSVVALSASAKALLARLGVLDRLLQPPSPIWQMALAVPDALADAVNFAADQQAGDAALAYVFSRADLAQACVASLRDSSAIFCCDDLASWSNGVGEIKTEGGVLQAELCIDAVGRNSHLRAAAGIDALAQHYEQSALVCYLDLAAPHDNEAVQIFTALGPLALLPLPASHRVALVWSVAQAQAEALKAVEVSLFQQIVYEQSGVAVSDIGMRALQPLSSLLAGQFHQQDLALLGESAHVVHPLAGQGLNLTLRDSASVAFYAARARDLGLSLSALLADYGQERRADAAAMLALTHFISERFTQRPIAQAALMSAGHLVQGDPRFANLILAHADHGISAPPPLMRA
jgi:ubiquinone biosynthesis UbiH/UbiF/VisC/COQ6 family hydroxylase